MLKSMVAVVRRAAERRCCPPTGPRDADTPKPTSFRTTAVDRVWATIPSGDYIIGGNDWDANRGDDEGPVRTLGIEGFSIAATAVTNGQFAEFVKSTGYRTEAENLGWSFVFQSLVSPRAAARVRKWSAEAPWWHVVEGACWRWPGGRGSHVRGKGDYPVVQISWHDAVAYCQWSGTRLPTEAEWEIAARGGLVQARYPWGDELTPDGMHMCNIWQGAFPDHDLAVDGYHGPAPVRSYPPNGYGLYEMAGNVWEWCDSPWSASGNPNPDGQFASEAVSEKVMRGGSFLCHESYCNRYRVAARTFNSTSSASSNIGFRVVATNKRA